MTHEELCKKIRGNIVPLPAQFNDDLSLNRDGYKEHIAFLLKNGIKNIYLALSASEFKYMTLQERLEVTELAVKEINGQAVVLAQPVGGGCVEAFISEAKAMLALGVDGLVIKPIELAQGQKFFSSNYRKAGYSSNRQNVDAFIIDFFKDIAQSTGAAIIFHDKPFCSFELTEQILAINGVIGYKSHETDPWTRQQLYSRFGNRVVCFDGLSKADQLWSFSWGAKARHTCWSWFDPERDELFFNLISKRDFKAAVDLVNEEWVFADAILSTGFHGYKIAMGLLGLPSGPVRIPGGNVGQEGKEMIKGALSKMGYL